MSKKKTFTAQDVGLMVKRPTRFIYREIERGKLNAEKVDGAWQIGWLDCQRYVGGRNVLLQLEKRLQRMKKRR